MDTLLAKRRMMLEHSEWEGDFIGSGTPGISLHQAYMKDSSYHWTYYNDASTSVRFPVTPGVTYRLHLDDSFHSSIYMVGLVKTDTVPKSGTQVTVYKQVNEKGYLISGRTEWQDVYPEELFKDVVFKIEKSTDPSVPDIKYMVIQVGGIKPADDPTGERRYALFNHIWLQKK